MDGRLTGLIVADGDDAGFKSKTPKVLHSLLGISLLRMTAGVLREIGPAQTVIASGIPRDSVEAEFTDDPVEIVALPFEKGPASVGRVLRKILAGNPSGDVLVLPADIPAVEPALLRALVSRHRRRGYACTMLWAVLDDRAKNDPAERFFAEAKSRREPILARPDPTGIFVFSVPDLLSVLSRTVKASPSGKVDFAAAFSLLASSGRPMGVLLAPEPEDVRRVRSRFDLGLQADRMRLRKIKALAESGVTVLSPSTTWIDWAVKIGSETVIYPGAVIEGPTIIGRNCRIYPNSHILRSTLGDDVQVLGSTVIEEATLENDVRIGPFARVRMQTILRSGSRVGNFVEMKKTDFGSRSKAMHLSYLGDSEIGEAANIGAGTITCNYDGVNKNRTVIGAGAFIGSGSELIAPVRIGRGAYVAAGSVITQDVADDALAVARGRQVEKPGWASARRAELAEAKAAAPKK